MEVVFVILIVLVLLFGLYLLLIMPKRGKRALMIKQKLYAHRGYFNSALGIPENSLAAFRRAKAFGYGVEFDIQLTKDKKVVVFHDRTLKRMCGSDKKVSDLTYDQLCKFKLSGTEEHIPLLTDVLELLGKDVPLLCEIKIYGSATDTSICDVALPILRRFKENLVIESFNPFVLFWFRTNAPEIPRGQLSCNFSHGKTEDPNIFVGFIIKNLLLNILAAPDFIAYRHSDCRCVSFKLMKALYKPLTACWTVRNDKEQRYSTSRSGFDAVIFEGYQALPISAQPSSKKRKA